MKYCIKNALIVNEGRSFEGSVVIDGERICEILEGHDALPVAAQIPAVNADGLVLIPGVIDSHVHFRDPGLTHKGDFRSESRAAAAGGVTTVLDMPNTLPQTTSQDALEAKLALAEEKCLVNYGAYLGLTHQNAAHLDSINPNLYCALKVFMGSSTGGMLVDDTDLLAPVFRQARTPIVTHCEDSALINANAERIRQAYGDSAPVALHSEIRPAEACIRSTRKAVSLASQHGTRLHVAHVSTAAEIDLIAQAPCNISAEVCTSYLLFTSDDYARLGARIKCNPAIKSTSDRSALRRAVADGRVFSIGTDHAPHRLAEKRGGCLQAASGMPMLQFSLPALLNLVDEGVLSLPRLVELTSHAPARLFGIKERGYLRVGYKADLTLLRPHAPWILTPNRIESLCNWSPLEGYRFNWRIERTICNGHSVFTDGHVDTRVGAGQAIAYDR